MNIKCNIYKIYTCYCFSVGGGMMGDSILFYVLLNIFQVFYHDYRLFCDMKYEKIPKPFISRDINQMMLKGWHRDKWSKRSQEMKIVKGVTEYMESIILFFLLLQILYLIQKLKRRYVTNSMDTTVSHWLQKKLCAQEYKNSLEANVAKTIGSL